MPKRGRPKKDATEKYVLKAFKFPPEMWEEFASLVPSKERSATLRDYVKREIKRRKRH